MAVHGSECLPSRRHGSICGGRAATDRAMSDVASVDLVTQHDVASVDLVTQHDVASVDLVTQHDVASVDLVTLRGLAGLPIG